MRAETPAAPAAEARPRRAPAPPPAAARRLVVVTGKGGVGKTTVAAALALNAAARGRRVVVCEIGGDARLPRLFERRPRGAGRLGRLDDDVWTVAIDAERALDEWLSRTIGRPGAALAMRSSSFRQLTAAAPAAHQLVTMGKAWDLAQPRPDAARGPRFDLCIVDAPSTGHAVALLRAPATYATIARAGPVARQARTISESLRSVRETAVVGVTQPSELPVTETFELDAAVRETLGHGLDVVVVNAVLPARFSARDLRALRRARRERPVQGLVGAERAAGWFYAQRRGQDEQLSRLVTSVDVPLVQLPFVFADHLGPAELHALAGELGVALEDGS